MRVLSLTHAHLDKQGLSPVSCERADSIVGNWGSEMQWDVDVVYTERTRWAGIWPNGEGLKVNVISVAAPVRLMIDNDVLFFASLKELTSKRKYTAIFSLVANRLRKKARYHFSRNGLIISSTFAKARKWGNYLLNTPRLADQKYDFIFVCIGYGDEYLLETAYTISKNKNIPLVVDFRDLWSDHHDPTRFDDRERKVIKKYEARLLKQAILLSVPQRPMIPFLQWTKVPVHFTSHSAHVEPGWNDGAVVSHEFRLLYAGKLYQGSPGLTMLLQMIKRISELKPTKQFKCHFYTDETEKIKTLVLSMNIQDYVIIHNWVSPSAIWTEMRSAHLLVTFDTGSTMPILMTKAYQYAHTGRPILALYKDDNEVYDEFFELYNAGKIFKDVNEAANWVLQLMNDEQQYEVMPKRKKVPFRKDIAYELGTRIESILNKH